MGASMSITAGSTSACLHRPHKALWLQRGSVFSMSPSRVWHCILLTQDYSSTEAGEVCFCRRPVITGLRPYLIRNLCLSRFSSHQSYTCLNPGLCGIRHCRRHCHRQPSSTSMSDVRIICSITFHGNRGPCKVNMPKQDPVSSSETNFSTFQHKT